MQKVKEKLKEVKVKDIFELGRGRVISHKEINENLGDYPVYSSQSKNNGEMGRINSYDFDGEYITWTTDGAYAGSVFYRNGKFNCTNVCGTLKAKSDKIDLRFLAFVLGREAKKHVVYCGNPKLMNNIVADIKLSLPPLAEQKKIAGILSKVDEDIEKTDEVIKKTEEMKRGLMQELFTKGIGHTKFKKTKLGMIPKEWEVLKLSDVAEFSNGKAHEKHIIEGGKYIVINSKFISTEGRVFKKTNENMSPLSAGDIAMVMSDIPNGKALAKCFLVKCDKQYTLNQRICSVKAAKINYRFLFYVLNRNKYYLNFDDGVGQTNLRKEEVLKCPVPMPSRQEQNKIVGIVSKIDEKIDIYKKIKLKLGILKKGLMQDLLSAGKI